MNVIKTAIEGVVIILDESLGIDRRIREKAILSEKGTKHPLLREFVSPFEFEIKKIELRGGEPAGLS